MIHSLPAFAFLAEAGIYLPTPEGWKAELAASWVLFADIINIYE